MLKVHKHENFVGSDSELFPYFLLVIVKYKSFVENFFYSADIWEDRNVPRILSIRTMAFLLQDCKIFFFNSTHIDPV